MSSIALARPPLADRGRPALSVAADIAMLPARGEPLRIVHVLRAPLGGLFRHVLDLTRAQVERGHMVGLVTDKSTGGPNADRILTELLPSLELGLIRMPMRRPPHPSDLANLVKINRHLRQAKPDVVHGHGAKGGFYARGTGFLPDAVPAIRAYTPHGGSFNQAPGSAKHRLYMKVERWLARRTDVLLFESAYIGQRFDAFIGDTSVLKRVVPNGIAPAEFIPVTPERGAADFVYVGELRAAKGIDTLISALAEVGRRLSSRPRLVLVGSGPDAEALRQQAASLGLSDQIDMPGQMPARNAFARGRINIVPSRSESLPYVVLEAAGAHMPIISTDVGGIPEIFGPYRERLIPCNDAQVLANAMQLMLQSSERSRATAADELATYVQGRFSFENMVAAVIAGYRDAMAIRRKPGTAVSTVQ